MSSIIVVRSLSIAAYGRLSYYLWLASVISSVGLLAFPSSLTKIVSQLYGSGDIEEAEALIPWVGQILFILNTTIALIVVGLAFTASPASRPLLLILAVSLLPGAMARVLNSRVLAKEQYQISMVASIVTSIVTLGAVVVAHSLKSNTDGYEAVLLGGGLIQLAVLFVSSRGSPIVRFGRIWTSTSARKTYMMYFVPSTLLALFDLVVWQRSEVYFLNRFAPYSQVAFYSISYTLFSVFHLLGAALLNGLFPSASHDFGAGNLPLLVEKARAGLTLAGFYAFPIALGGIAVAPTVLSLFYGRQISPAGPVAQILMAGVVPGALAVAMTMTLSAGGEIWRVVRVGALFSVVNLVLDLILISRGLAIGAALANTLTQTGYAVTVVGACLITFRFRPPWRWLLLCGVASFALPFGIPMVLSVTGLHGIVLVLAMLLGYALYWWVCWRAGIWRALRI